MNATLKLFLLSTFLHGKSRGDGGADGNYSLTSTTSSLVLRNTWVRNETSTQIRVSIQRNASMNIHTLTYLYNFLSIYTQHFYSLSRLHPHYAIITTHYWLSTRRPMEPIGMIPVGFSTVQQAQIIARRSMALLVRLCMCLKIHTINCIRWIFLGSV